jgi:hypothetical protein
MFKSHLMAVLLVVLFVSFLAIQPANAICRSQATAHMNYDTSNPSEDGPYDPCNDNITWNMSFYRTAETESPTILDFRLLNSGGGHYYRQEFSSANYDPSEWHYPQGSAYVGSSTWHKLNLRKYSGPGGHFNDISLQVNYVAGNPDDQEQ